MMKTLKNNRTFKRIGVIIPVVLVPLVFALFFILRAKEEEPIKIGAILSISGPASYAGEGVRDGMLLAIDEFNLRGGINGRKIELIIEDSETNPQKGQEAFTKIEATRHPLLYVSILSSVGMALAPLAEENRVLLVGLITTAPEFTEQKEWVFRYFPTAKDSVPPILSLLEKLKVKDLGVIYLNDEFGRSHFQLTRKEFERAGGIVRGESYEGKDPDFKEQIAKLKDAEAIYAVVRASHFESFFAQLKKEKYSGIRVGSGNVSVPSVRKLPEANGVYLASPIIYDPKYIFAREAKNRYEAKYGKPFNHYAASGYDIIKLVAGLLEDKVISREGVKDLFEEGFIFPGVFGYIDVKPGEHDIRFPLYPAQIVNGEIEYLR